MPPTFWGQNVLPFQDLEPLELTHTIVGIGISLITSENYLVVCTKADSTYILWLNNFTSRDKPNTYVHQNTCTSSWKRYSY